MEQWTDYKFEYENTFKVLQDQWKINDKLKKEKQGLIKYIEDKINDVNIRLVKIDKSELDLILLSELSIYQEILDKVKGGNYE